MPYPELMTDLRKIVRHELPSRVPCLALSEEFDVKWYNRGTYQEITDDPQRLADCWSAAIDEFGYDWAWVQLDDCLEFEPLGVGVKGDGNILRATCGYLPATRETLRGLRRIRPRHDGRLPILLAAIGKLRQRYGDSVCVCGRNAAPFSCTALLYGIEPTMLLILEDPGLLQATCEFFVELAADLARAQYEAGAHAVWTGDCNAMSNLISLEQYTRCAFAPCRELVTRQRAAGLLTFLHNSEIRLPYIVKQCEVGADVMSIGPEGNLAAAKAATHGRVTLSGNLDPVNVLLNGSPEQVAAECRRLIGIGKPGGGYVFNSGEMIPRDTPEANMHAFCEGVRQWGRY